MSQVAPHQVPTGISVVGAAGLPTVVANADALARLLPILPPGSVVLIVGTMMTDSEEKRPTAAERPSDPLGVRSHPATTVSAPHVAANEGKSTVSALEQVSEIVQTNSEEKATPAEWARRLGLSARALVRAIDVGALKYETKRDGKDHGAKLVRADAVMSFLATVEAVKHGQCAAPGWWHRVFGRRAWSTQNVRTARVG